MLHKFYFTCGQKHRHELDNGHVWDKDSVVKVEIDSRDMLDASQRAYNFIIKTFGAQWAEFYHADNFNLEIFAKDGIAATYIIPSDYESIIE